MKKEKFQAPTIEEAIQKGLDKYHVTREMVTVDIIQRDRKGFFGLGEKDAIVALTFAQTPEAAEVETPKSEEKVTTIPENEQLGESGINKTELDKAPNTGDKPIMSVDTNEEMATEPAVEATEGELPSEENEQSDTISEGEVPTKQREVKAEVASEIDNDDVQSQEVENIEMVARYLMNVCEAYLAPITVDVEDYGDEIIYHLNTDKPGLVIGKHGKIINSLETLAKVLTHRHVRNRIHVSVNVGDYRERRQNTLENLANRTAEKVMATQKAIHLDPLPAAERKIIHSQLAKYDHIATSSQGREPHRHLVIKYVD